MQRPLRIAAIQLRAHNRSAFGERLPALLDRIQSAAKENQLLVVPEGTMPAYVLGDAQIDAAKQVEAIEGLRAIARLHSCVIVAGVATEVDRTLRNSAIVIDADGTIAGRADKVFLWHFDRKWFSAGERIAPIHTSIGTLGVLICADGRMPGIARALVDAGAELLVMPTAWVTSGRDPNALENIQADLLARTRAFENDVPFIAANKCGVEDAMVAYCGKSQIVDRDGSILALAPERDEAVISAEITLAAPAPVRVAKAAPTQRDAVEERTIRVAISPAAFIDDLDRRLEILDAELALSPGEIAGATRLDRVVPTIRVDADAIRDPGTLIAYRLAGYRCAIVESKTAHAWLERVVRARAAELRMYVIVFEPNRAYACDPDGVIIAGTFDDYRVASFALDIRRTQQTMVAPGTDVAAGLERVEVLGAREVRA